MMKNIFNILFLLLISNAQVFGQKVLIRFQLYEFQKPGYGIDMYYVADSLKQVEDNIMHLQTPTERNLLKLFVHPMVLPGETIHDCTNVDKLNMSWKEIFRTKRKYIVRTNKYKVILDIAFANVQYCEFALTNKYWGSYDVEFKKAIVLTKIIYYQKTSKDEVQRVKYILSRLKEKLEE